MPAPAAGTPVTVAAGHANEQVSLHVLLPGTVSLSKRYSVKPLASTSTLPSGVVATLTLAGAAGTVVVGATVVVDASVEAVEFEGLEVLLLLPHAASAKAAT